MGAILGLFALWQRISIRWLLLQGLPRWTSTYIGSLHPRPESLSPFIRISVKSGKDSTSTLTLVIHRVRFVKSLQKSTLAFKGRWNSGSPCLSFFLERLHCCYIDFHCSYRYSYYNSSRTLCIKCWVLHFVLSFSISCRDLIKFPYFADTTKRGVRGWKEAQRQGEDRVTFGIPPLSSSCSHMGFLFCFSMEGLMRILA